MKNKRGQVGLETGKAVMLALLTLGVIAFALIIAMNSLSTSGTEAGSQARNQTQNIFSNITTGVTDFFSNAGTWFSLLAVVVIILIVAIVIFAVNRFGGRGGL